MMKASEFVRRVEGVAKLHTTYAWGSFGWPLTAATIDRAVSAYPSHNAAKKARWTGYIGKNYFMLDCIGLIKAVLWGFSGDVAKTYGGAVYASGGVGDESADSTIAKCGGVSTDFAAIAPGECVWLPGHIGVYIGGGKVAECTPAWADGVQVTACLNIGSVAGLSGRRWTKHGRLPWVDYTADITPMQQDKQYAAGVARYTLESTGLYDGKKAIRALAAKERLTYHGNHRMVDGVKWAYVRCGDGVQGYVRADKLATKAV